MWFLTLWFAVVLPDLNVVEQRRVDIPMASNNACKAEYFRVRNARLPFEARERAEAQNGTPHQIGLLGADVGYPVLDAPWELQSEGCEFVERGPGV